jgi:hypothetical protein
MPAHPLYVIRVRLGAARFAHGFAISFAKCKDVGRSNYNGNRIRANAGVCQPPSGP